jgi:hypothetical protein
VPDLKRHSSTLPGQRYAQPSSFPNRPLVALEIDWRGFREFLAIGSETALKAMTNRNTRREDIAEKFTLSQRAGARDRF